MKNKSAKAKSWLGVAAGSVMAMSASVAHAVIVESESNDTFGSANAGSTSGTGNTNTINQSLVGSVGDATAPSNDVDIWSFNLVAGRSFGAHIGYTGAYNPYDVSPVMTLYMENGGSYYAIASTDPQSFGTDILVDIWATGTYYLAVTADFNQGQDAFGNLVSTPGFLTSEDIQGTAFDSFHGQSFTSFDYVVTAVPVPAAAWLFGSGLLGLVGVARRRKQQA